MSNPTITQCGPEGKWLLVCAKTQESVPTLNQLDVCSIGIDRELFTAMRNSYMNLRGRWKHLLSFRTIKGIKFVNVRYRTYFHRHDISVK